MKVTVPIWKFYEFAEIWEITAWKDRCIFKTKNLNKYVAKADPDFKRINKKKYQAVVVDYRAILGYRSIREVKGDECVVLDVVPASEFV